MPRSTRGKRAGRVPRIRPPAPRFRVSFKDYLSKALLDAGDAADRLGETQRSFYQKLFENVSEAQRKRALLGSPVERVIDPSKFRYSIKNNVENVYGLAPESWNGLVYPSSRSSYYSGALYDSLLYGDYSLSSPTSMKLVSEPPSLIVSPERSSVDDVPALSGYTRKSATFPEQGEPDSHGRSGTEEATMATLVTDDPSQVTSLFRFPMGGDYPELNTALTELESLKGVVSNVRAKATSAVFDFNPAATYFVCTILKYKFRPGKVGEDAMHVFTLESDRGVEMRMKLTGEQFASMMTTMDVAPPELKGRLVLCVAGDDRTGLRLEQILDPLKDAQEVDKEDRTTPHDRFGNLLFVNAPILGRYGGEIKRGVVISDGLDADGDVRVRWDGMLADSTGQFVQPGTLTRGF